MKTPRPRPGMLKAAYAALRDSSAATAAQDAVTMAWWHGAGQRQGDLFLCSYPKSGRTWLRFLLVDYQLRIAGCDFALTLENLPLLSPNLTLLSRFRLRRPPLDGLTRRIIGTHSEVPGLFRGQPILVLRRDPRDVLVSSYYHRLARGEIAAGLESYVFSRRGLPAVVRYHNRWSRGLRRFSPCDVLELTYEELRADTAGWLRRCLRFLGLEERDDLVAQAVEHSSRQNMRRLEARWGSPDFSPRALARNDKAFQVRKAEVGGFREELSADVIERIEAVLRRDLEGGGGHYD